MSWDDFKDKPTKEEEAKKSIYRSINTGYFYCVLRVGKRFKQIGNIKNFERHMERQMQVANADNKIKNEIIIGSANVTEDVKKYLEGINVRSNNVLATELLLTASPGFFRGMPQQELNKWVELNRRWLEKEFGNNLQYAVLHLDESTPHIHALVVPVFTNDKGNRILANKRYFGGRERLRHYQDIYSLEMKNTFKSLNRGIKYSKAKHIEIRHFYTMINTQINEKDLQQLCVRAKNSELLEIKIRSIQKTLETYKEYSRKSDAEKQLLLQNNKDLSKNIKELSKDKELFHEALEILSQQYKLPQYAVKEALRYASNQLEQSHERSIGK